MAGDGGCGGGDNVWSVGGVGNDGCGVEEGGGDSFTDLGNFTHNLNSLHNQLLCKDVFV